MNKATSAPSGVEVAVVDYERPETLEAALKAVSTVFLVGPPTAQVVELERRAMESIQNARGGSRCEHHNEKGEGNFPHASFHIPELRGIADNFMCILRPGALNETA